MSRIPVSLDPFLPRALNQRWEGTLGADELPRVRAAALEGGPVLVRMTMQIAHGALGETRVQGTIDGEIGLQCQRCLQPMIWHCSLRPDVVLADPSGSPPVVGDDQDVLELGSDGLLRPNAFVEDEILLALPLAPRHEACDAGLPREFEAGTGDGATESPFAVLEALKKKH